MQSRCGVWAQVVCMVLVAASAGCSKGGSSFNAAEVRPPVAANTPIALKSLSSAASSRLGLSARIAESALLATCSTDGSLEGDIAARFFCAGPTETLNILKNIDDRMAELEARSEEMDRQCLKNAAQLITFKFASDNQAFPMYFQCFDLFSDGLDGVAFGEKDGTWYLHQTQSGVGRNGIWASVDPAGNVEAWISVGNTALSGSQSLMHLKSKAVTKEIEFSVAGAGVGFCSAQFHSNATHVYVSGSQGDPGNCQAPATACLNASTYVSAPGECGAISAFDAGIPKLDVSTNVNWQAIYNYSDSTASGVKDITPFNSEAK